MTNTTSQADESIYQEVKDVQIQEGLDTNTISQHFDDINGEKVIVYSNGTSVSFNYNTKKSKIIAIRHRIKKLLEKK